MTPTFLLNIAGCKNLLAAVVALTFLAAFLGCTETANGCDAIESERIEISGTTMGPIPYSVVVIKDDETPDEEVLGRAVQKTLEQINDLMSTYKPDSDISRFNRAQSTEWIEVDADTAKVVIRAIEISRLSDGAFDITVGPAVDLWHFGPNKETKFVLPKPAEIDKVKEIVGWEKIAARLDPPSLQKTMPSVQIDLSAIAKGYAVDKVVAELVSLNCQNVLVEVGGEVAAHGRPSPETLWKVGVEKPQEGFPREIEQVAEIENKGMATSGDYRNFNVVDGKRYSHSIDPVTCWPAENDLATACVIAEDCMTADAFATAVMVLGPEKGWELCERLNLPLLIIERTSPDPLSPIQFKKRMSSDFPASPKPTVLAPKAGILPVFISATIVFALAILGMAAGAILGNKQIQGSCGGLANMSAENGESACSLCENPKTECVETKA